MLGYNSWLWFCLQLKAMSMANMPSYNSWLCLQVTAMSRYARLQEPYLGHVQISPVTTAGNFYGLKPCPVFLVTAAGYIYRLKPCPDIPSHNSWLCLQVKAMSRYHQSQQLVMFTG